MPATQCSELAGKEYQDWAFHAAAISPDGERVAYSTFEHPGRPAEERLPGAFDYEIGVLQIDGSLRQLLTANRDYDDYPAWSPDGSQVAFVQWGFDSGYRDRGRGRGEPAGNRSCVGSGAAARVERQTGSRVVTRWRTDRLCRLRPNPTCADR